MVAASLVQQTKWSGEACSGGATVLKLTLRSRKGLLEVPNPAGIVGLVELMVVSVLSVPPSAPPLARPHAPSYAPPSVPPYVPSQRLDKLGL